MFPPGIWQEGPCPLFLLHSPRWDGAQETSVSLEEAQTSWDEVLSVQGKREGFVRHMGVQVRERYMCSNKCAKGRKET